MTQVVNSGAGSAPANAPSVSQQNGLRGERGMTSGDDERRQSFETVLETADGTKNAKAGIDPGSNGTPRRNIAMFVDVRALDANAVTKTSGDGDVAVPSTADQFTTPGQAAAFLGLLSSQDEQISPDAQAMAGAIATQQPDKANATVLSPPVTPDPALSLPSAVQAGAVIANLAAGQSQTGSAPGQPGSRNALQHLSGSVASGALGGSPSAQGAGAAANTPQDTLFRFARSADAQTLNAPGSGAVELALASSGADPDTGSLGGRLQGLENVTIVENRRFLAVQSPVSNASQLASAIASNPQWAEALRNPALAGASSLLGAGTRSPANMIKLQLHPAELGAVTAQLRLSGDVLVVDLKVETVEALRHLSSESSGLLNALRGQGFNVESISVQHNAQERAGMAANGQTLSQGEGQGFQSGSEAGKGAGGQRPSGDDGSDRASGHEGDADGGSVPAGEHLAVRGVYV